MEIYELYGGKVQLHYDDNKHLYMVDGYQADGVTSILKVINKPALVPWAVKCTTDYILSKLVAGKPLDEIEIKQLCDEAKKAHRNKTEEAADIGTYVHQWVEDFINGKNPAMPINEQIRNGVEAFIKWKDEHKVKFLSTEQKIYSKKYKYAGTYDFEAVIDGKTYLGDIKTSSGIYNEYFFQVAAYQHARQEEDPTRNYHGVVIVNCRKDGNLDVQTSTEFDKNFKAFMAALVLHRRLNEMA